MSDDDRAPGAPGGWAGADYELDVEARLTHRQREAILAARKLGFYDGLPRGVRVQEIADELDISIRAASRRLRGAENALMGEATRLIKLSTICPFCDEMVRDIPSHIPEDCAARGEAEARMEAGGR